MVLVLKSWVFTFLPSSISVICMRMKLDTRFAIGLGLATLLFSGCGYVGMFTAPVVDDDKTIVYIHTGQPYASFLDSLGETGLINPYANFRGAAETFNYEVSFKPGRYRLKKGMTAVDVVKHLRSGNREPVKFSFHYVRTPEALAGKVAGKLEVDSSQLVALLADPEFTKGKFGFTPEEMPAMFIPNTYEIHWNITAEQFCERMKKEYDKFWTQGRKDKAQALGLTQTEVSTLASLVQAEQSRLKEEWPVIAGLYLNRLNKGMLLQADPTVVFANNDFTIKRVLDRHLAIDSPYNTYKYAGLPPGPINMPEPEVIDAVLDADDNNYLYMCAKEDLSGRHSFAVTLTEHNKNAAAYHAALRKAGIR